jgi:hypothetical protein
MLRRLGLLAMIAVAIFALLVKMSADGVFSASLGYQAFIVIGGLCVAVLAIRAATKNAKSN